MVREKYNEKNIYILTVEILALKDGISSWSLWEMRKL